MGSQAQQLSAEQGVTFVAGGNVCDHWAKRERVMDCGRPRNPRHHVDPVIERFFHPRNAGRIGNPDGVGALGDPKCGDYFKVWIRG